MNGSDDFIGRLEEYLDDFDGATPLPGHVRDAIHAELPWTHQARPATGPRRLLIMLSDTSARARWGITAAAIVVAVIVGGAFLSNQNPQGTVGAPAAPTAAPTPAPTATPTPTPSTLAMAPLAPCSISATGAPACIKPGTYTLSPGDWPAAITFDVPEGWWDWLAGVAFDGVLVDAPPPAADGSGWGVMFMTVGDVSRDPCDPTAGTFASRDVDTPEELAAAMATWPGFDATTPEPISIDGADGVLVELTSTRTPLQCPDGSFIWKTGGGTLVDPYPTVGADGQRRPGQFRILDVGGKLLVIRTTDFPDPSPYESEQGVAPDPTRHTADQVEMHAILDSIKLRDPQS